MKKMKKLAINPSNKKYYSKEYIKGWEDGVKAQYEATIDAVQGEWVRKEKEINDCDGHRAFYWFECDQCGSRPPKDTWGHEWHSNFCPNCGARMEGGGNK